MTALITFAQAFQHFHLVRGDRFAPFNHLNATIPRQFAGLYAILVIIRPYWTAVIHVTPSSSVIMHEERAVCQAGR